MGEKTNNAFIAIGLMLFALFFGAGNLIFPVFMGQNAGVYTIPATIGFLITGVGLPLLGVLAICYSGVNLRELAGRIHPAYSIFFCTALYLTIGPFFAAPRTATVAYEIAVAQYLPPEMRSMGLYVFAAVFFYHYLVACDFTVQTGGPGRQVHDSRPSGIPFPFDYQCHCLAHGKLAGTGSCL